MATVRVGPAFDGLRPGAGRAHAAWVAEAMAGRAGVSLVVPSGFQAYVRIHHRIHTGERWADLAPEYLTRGDEPLDSVGSKLEFIDGDGNLDADYVDALTAVLANATATPRDCHYALWQGWGWVRQGSLTVTSRPRDAEATRAVNHAIAEAMEPVWKLAAACPVEPWWGGRDMILFDGAIDAVSAIGYPSLGDGVAHRQCPQWWWPDDRAWFVGTEIDDPWTYVAGSRILVEEILASTIWEAVRVEPTDSW